MAATEIEKIHNNGCGGQVRMRPAENLTDIIYECEKCGRELDVDEWVFGDKIMPLRPWRK